MRHDILKGVLAVVMTTTLGSCSLDRYPLTSFSEETFFESEDNAKLALVSLYRGEISYGVDYNASDWWSYSTIAFLDGITDIGYDRRGFNNALGQLTSGQLTETNGWVKNLYQKPYKRISACNRFILGLTGIDNPSAQVTRMHAEARFIRATQYFYLASFYHDVPLVTRVLTLDEANNVEKNKREEVMDFIVTEMTELSKILPRHKDILGSERGRASSQAALVFLARVNLLRKDYVAAADACEQIIEMGDNQLYDNYQKLFHPSAEEASEHIFSVQYVDDLAGHGLPQHAFPIKDGGWCLANATNHLFEAYDFVDGTPFNYEDERFDPANFGRNRDPRLDYTIYYHGATFKGTEYLCDPETKSADKIGPGQTTQTGFLLRKYFDEGWSGDLSKYGNNMPIARYADVLMMYLEAEMEAGTPITQTLLDETINAIRARVGMPAITETNPDKLRTIIQKERMIEFAFEGLRLWDLFRWGNAVEVLNQDLYGSPFYVDVDLIKKKDGQIDPYNRWYVNKRSFEADQVRWPIPLAETNINPNLLK